MTAAVPVKKAKIKQKDIHAILLYSEKLVVENATLRAVLNRREGPNWKIPYNRIQPTIERNLDPRFQSLHALLREGRLEDLVHRLVEEVGTHGDQEDE